MTLPFTPAEFFDIFRRYNDAVFPMQGVLVAVAVAILILAARRVRGRTAYVLLASLWVWMGVVYHFGFFRQINPAAAIFAIAFVAQGAILVMVAARGPQLGITPDSQGMTGVLFAAYALIGYPALAYALGQHYPAMPTFGLPCPTTIFTFAVLLWTRPLQSLWAWAVPVVWAAVGTSAAIQLGVGEDFALPVAAAGAVCLVVRQRINARVSDSSL